MKEAGNEGAGRRTETGCEARPSQGERASFREALVTKAKPRRSGGRATKVDVLTWGDLARARKGDAATRREESAEAVVGKSKPVWAHRLRTLEAFGGTKGRTEGRAKRA